tara:strand:- start:130 stop:351 length:222 start_codon:yes stop_codon:yes gene_type:complete
MGATHEAFPLRNAPEIRKMARTGEKLYRDGYDKGMCRENPIKRTAARRIQVCLKGLSLESEECMIKRTVMEVS